MTTGDQRTVGQFAAHGDRFDDAGSVGRGRPRRRALGPSPPVRQVVADGKPATSGPLVAKSSQQCGFAVAAGTVGQYDDTGRRAVGLVRDAGDRVELLTAPT